MSLVAASAPATSVRTGATVWLTGLPSAGKTTLAAGLADRLRAEGRAVEVLDGDEVRTVLSPELGYSRADRDANVARIGWVAGRMAAHGGLNGLTGVDGEYEPPATPELRIDTSGRSVDDAVEELLAMQRKENLA